MPRIRCAYDDCVFLTKGFCSKAVIDLDPDEGCITYSDDVDDINNSPLAAFEEDDLDDFEDDTWEDEGFEELDLEEDDY